MRSITLPANISSLYETLSFVDTYAKESGFRGQYPHIELAVEEIFSNIAYYAYPESEGMVEIICRREAESLVVQFTDTGIPYNPLKKQDPDISVGADLRPVGGLGIYLVKQYMDFVGYERKDGKNIVTLKKQ